ncbi:uncharacterized protein LOC144908480 [Branchiostoma floridae x Branchiostoma belcheri]
MPPGDTGTGTGVTSIVMASSADLEQECEKILSDKELFNDYVARMNHWMRQNNGRVIDLFRKFDKNGDSVVSYEEFKEGMQRLGAPCSLAELHLLAKLLDTDNSRTIDYMEFSKGLRYMRKI